MTRGKFLLSLFGLPFLSSNKESESPTTLHEEDIVLQVLGPDEEPVFAVTRDGNVYKKGVDQKVWSRL